MASKQQPIYTTSSCLYCNKLDTNDMVQCDSCDDWFHFTCVGVDNNIAFRNWSCDNCKYVLPKSNPLDKDKENRSPIINWRKPKSIRTMTSISSTQGKDLALQRLEEERLLVAKRDQEYLRKKYSILEGDVDEYEELGEREHNDDVDKSSFENTLRWAKEVQQLSNNFTHKFTPHNVSISMSESERLTFDQRFQPQASSSTNVQRQRYAHPGHRSTGQLKTEVLRPMQSKATSNEANVTYIHKNVKPSGTTAKTNPIQPARLQFGSQQQPTTNVNMDPANPFNLSAGQTKPTIKNVFANPPTIDFRSGKIQKESAVNHYCSSTYRNAPPKLDFDKFGFSSMKRPQLNEQINSTTKISQSLFNDQPLTRQPAISHPGISQSSFSQPAVNQPSIIPQTSNHPAPQANTGNLIDYKELCKDVVVLTSGQIATRHSMERKYPQFFGDPLKWQMFESAFVNATKACGLNNAENLSRLLDCLKGDALTAVQCRLLHSSAVPGVMETLRLLFGRPELVIEKLMKEINEIPALTSDDLAAFVKFAILVQNLCSTVQAYNSMRHLHNPMLLKELVSKLPTQFKLTWACYKTTLADDNLATFSDWIFSLATVASDVLTTESDSQNEKKVRKNDTSKNTQSNNYTNSTNSVKPAQITADSGVYSKSQKKCPACNRDFCVKLGFCEKFKKLSRQERWKLIKSNNICGCCLGNHRYFNCKQKVQCGVDGCSFFHHVLLHNETKGNNKKSDPKLDNPKQDHQSKQNSSEKTCNSINEVVPRSTYPEIFRIVPVKLFVNGIWERIYAYFDDGSNLTTLELSVAQKLGLCGTKESLCIKWSFGNTQMETDSSRVSVQISGVNDGDELFSLDDVRTVKQLKLPRQSITQNWLNQFSYLNNVPISTYKDAVPQMIIGLRYSKLMVSLETIEGNWNQPIACRTRLGWVIQGPNDRRISNDSSSKFSLNMCDCQKSYHNLHQLVKDFFSLESFGVKMTDNIVESKSLIRARNILESSVIKDGDHYNAALLWRTDDIKLPNSFDMAMRRLECVESKMTKNPVLAERMCAYLKDFLAKGYIRKLSQQEQQMYRPHTWYLPVFPVFNSKKPEKLRLVWDGAAKVHGVSLNSQLLAGPDQLVPLPDILRRFREACIGLSTDIIEMYHRVYVNEEDQDAQRFLWRDGDATRQPDVFVVRVLPFGLSCSPAIAQFVKNRNAQSFQQQYPKAVEAITQNHYVDDMIERAHDVESAVQLIKDVQLIHRQANFHLRNLISNSSKVLEAINGSPEFSDKILTDKLDINVERILGMYWNTTTDSFTYSLRFVKLQNLADGYCPTKREVLRIVMSVFDPLGFLTHLLIHAKVLLQEIWRTKITWDMPIPKSLAVKWSQWVQHLLQVETLHIPRLYSTRLSPKLPRSIQLHVFVDAGLEAYATVAYFRIENDEDADICLIGAKSRVAPIRPISVPRLELQGGVLGNRFAESILQSHSSLHIEKTIIWCDSKTVLYWLSTEPRRYTQFVAFRIGEILESQINAEWRWIPSEFNVADEATKTKTLPHLHSSSRWFVGPEFLRNFTSDFSFELDEPEFSTIEEVRPYYLLSHVEVPVSRLIEYERFSNWQRLVRTMAYVLRFIHNANLECQHRRVGTLSKDELLVAENRLFAQVQYDCFREEISIVRWNSTAPINNQKCLDKASIIRTCSPYLDEFGVLRVMGRLDNAHSISESARRPIILDRNHYVTRLIVYWYHRKYRHLHHQTVLNEIRQIFWIPKLRVLLNSIRNNCQKCKNTAAVPHIPQMGSIPRERFAVFTRPFTFVGVDYFGPIKVVVNRGTPKRWGVLFTCLTTRAIHLEIAHSMDTSSCIMCIRNFIGRKGTPQKVFADNGTNFHGADNTLRDEIAKLNYTKIQDEFSTFEWSFNPPTAAHMGGVWERMVGVVKRCLDEVLTVRYPNDEMLTSLFIEIENMVNSRPLTYVSLDTPYDEVLTPNHFIFGSSNGSKPPGEFTDADLLRNNWKAVQAMTDKFWRKFVDEYLPTLTRRTKWFNKVEPVKVGDVVLLADPNFQRNSWPKGIVVETFMDRTSQVRSAKVRTATGTIFRRPVSHLAVLDVAIPGQVKQNSPNPLTGARMSDNTDFGNTE